MEESCVSPLSEPVVVQSVSPSVSWVIQFSYLTPVQTHHSVSQSCQTTQTWHVANINSLKYALNIDKTAPEENLVQGV